MSETGPGPSASAAGTGGATPRTSAAIAPTLATGAAATDETLMLAWAGGDAEAFERLYERHRSALWRYLRHRTGDEGRAGELFQDIWTSVVRARAGYSPDAPFRAWLYRIARNRVVDHYRRRPDAAHERFDENTMADVTAIAPPLRPDELADLAERGDALQDALGRLPAAQREAMLLKHVAGMSLVEIADLVGESTETVKSRLRYAKTKLRQLLRGAP